MEGYLLTTGDVITKTDPRINLTLRDPSGDKINLTTWCAKAREDYRGAKLLLKRAEVSYHKKMKVQNAGETWVMASAPIRLNHWYDAPLYRLG